MSQPIEAGAVIGGRYQVTDLVMTSADGDEVLQGIDQVLNRPVSVLVGSSANSEQLSLSAREIATGERYAAVQVLDLGITEGRSYLVTNLAESADLLDLVIQSDAPYVEPFYTDTLGTEIFGVTRSKEPVTYEDDAEYYEDLHSQEDSRPAVLGKLPEINLGDKFSGLKDRFGRAKSAPSPAAPVVPPRTVGSTTEQAPAVFSPVSSPAAPAAAPVPPAAKVTRFESADSIAEPAVTSAAALAAAQKSRGVPVDDAGQRVASSFPAAAQSYTEVPYDDYEEEEPQEGGKKTTRLIVGAILCAVLVVAVVFAYNALGGGPEAPVASTSSAQASESAPGSSPESPNTALVKPKIADISRLVPGNQALNAETDNTLAKAIDGNPASLYKSYSYTNPQFGGLASNMVFVIELKEPSDISEIQLEGLNGSGGAFEIRVGDTNDLAEAKVLSSGSFTGPTVNVPVSGENGEALRGQYVFLDVTELPRRASGANGSRPYGLQIGEFRVS
ncbi:hypothetical protein [Paeniglutamicibacter kerguelensis]|uniref:ABC transporter substrate-binding protein n=1 Tax=Paeniglutamicibacter kerguelensis TaxID=254788 RepID=A0ABS4XIE4_9MICC|nr:hypothetical protein [Paeniglutamicibacter kerguelensis]MBP2388234.1 hypothetical protein [Paeniglutamicibacter kerguelensis]